MYPSASVSCTPAGAAPAGPSCHARKVSQVVASVTDGLPFGDLVFNPNDWTGYALIGEGAAGLCDSA